MRQMKKYDKTRKQIYDQHHDTNLWRIYILLHSNDLKSLNVGDFSEQTYSSTNSWDI